MSITNTPKSSKSSPNATFSPVIRSIPVRNKSDVIYKIDCPCGQAYVGQTGQKLASRIYQHKSDSSKPNKTCALATHVRQTVPESPAAVAGSKNLTGLPRVVRDIAADIYNNIQQWNSLHINGASTVKEMALLKTDSDKLYPDGLEPLANSLAETVNAMKTVISNLETVTTQLHSVIKLHKSVVPLFISWPAEKMWETAVVVYEASKQEFVLKRFIADNLPHIEGKSKLMFYAASWTYQPYITSEVNFYVESFLVETGHRSKT